MTAFESYTLDQFPLRDSFRQIKALFHYNALQQRDNNNIYLADGSAAELVYPLDMDSVDHAADRFNLIYDTYLKDSNCNIFFSVAPDKGYYLAEANGYPAMDYAAMLQSLRTQLPWASYIDITGMLEADDYYRTDTHWRQERLLEAAQVLCQGMGVSAFDPDSFTVTALERPFYGVYYGQAALPMEPETMYLMENEVISQCTVYDHAYDVQAQVYDRTKLDSKDLYDVYLSGVRSLLTIENPNATTDRELIVFRDSFGSSIVPLLVKDYATVVLVDIREIAPQRLGAFLEFSDQDVLFLYSSLVLNNSATIK